MSSSANDTQVGGTHYRNALQHWDYVAQNNIGYFEGQVTKYVARWDKKHPTDAGKLEDLRKAGHFLQKLMEVERERLTAGGLLPSLWKTQRHMLGTLHRAQAQTPCTADEFCKLHDLGALELRVYRCLEAWRMDAVDPFPALKGAMDALVQLTEAFTKTITPPASEVDVAAVEAEGKAAKEAGKYECDNPYWVKFHPTTPQEQAWRRGWHSGVAPGKVERRRMADRADGSEPGTGYVSQ